MVDYMLMRLKISIEYSKEILLPISYRYYIQSAIYKTLKDSKKFGNLHDEGYEYGKRRFKAFTFSDLSGKYSINGKNICFKNSCHFFISSPDKAMLDIIEKRIETYGLAIKDYVFKNVMVEKIERPHVENEINIYMKSPMCVRTTERESNKTTFYNPGDEKFANMIRENFHRKYAAYYGREPEGDVEIQPILVVPKHKKIINYKGFIYEGWMGRYKISGPQEALEFLYDTGLGSENAKGFGMFDIEE